ncbi:hypothetical protein LCGC14_0258710 [marine sediment metagenome]|uniref:Uncharacterized protein n=1 Tax=marine sediment metagenome TaxID=412755 RepID=A0A0F9WMS9_9ZZZZ
MQRIPESRYYTAEPYTAWNGTILLSEYEPFRYVDRDDNIVHAATEGDSWFTLAQMYYWMISIRAAGLYWIGCDFQPVPVVDPTLAIQGGTTIILPSAAVVRSEILGLRPEVFV